VRRGHAAAEDFWPIEDHSRAITPSEAAQDAIQHTVEDAVDSLNSLPLLTPVNCDDEERALVSHGSEAYQQVGPQGRPSGRCAGPMG
jgi:hypothetical protein